MNFPPKISFLIPLRGRHDQVNNCLSNIENVYGCYEYEVILAYQDDNTLFKRGQLINLAAKKANGNIFVIQDIDTRHLRKLDLEKSCVGFDKRETVIDIGNGFVKRTGKMAGRGLGAMVIVSKQSFFEAYGFSNVYFGWGCEDHSFARFRAKLSMFSGILGHIDHSPSSAAKNQPDWWKINREYFALEEKQKDYSKDSVHHTIADGLNNRRINAKSILYCFSNIRVSKDFGQMDWYLKQVAIDTKDKDAAMKIRYFLTPQPNQRNLGDHGQAYCLKNMFEGVFGKNNVFEYDRCSTSDGLNQVKKNDIIFMSSGGNLGDLWPPLEEIRRTIIRKCSDNLIVSFPQTIDFISKGEAEKSSVVYNAHSNLHVFARDPKSYSIAKELFSANNVQQLPDPVFTLSHIRNFKREGILCIFRKDKEERSKSEKEQIVSYCKSLGFSVDIVDTNLIHSVIDREKELLIFLDKVSKYKLVITDRFHGTVFASITGTPCFAIPTIDHKITEANFWYRRLESKTFVVKDFDEFKCGMSSIPNSYEYNSSLAKALYYHVLFSIKENKTVPILNLIQNCIVSRRTVRRWSKDKVSKEILYNIIKAGVYAPSGSNAQCVKFRIIEDKRKLELINKECYARTMFAPPIVIMVGYDFGKEKTINFNHKNKIWEPLKFQDVAAAIQNMLLYCESIGLACCWLSFFTKDRQEFLNSINIKDNNIEYLSGVAIGFAKSKIIFETRPHHKLSIKRQSIDHYIIKKQNV